MNTNILVQMNIRMQIPKNTTTHYKKNKYGKLRKGTEEATVVIFTEKTKAI